MRRPSYPRPAWTFSSTNFTESTSLLCGPSHGLSKSRSLQRLNMTTGNYSKPNISPHPPMSAKMRSVENGVRRNSLDLTLHTAANQGYWCKYIILPCMYSILFAKISRAIVVWMNLVTCSDKFRVCYESGWSRKTDFEINDEKQVGKNKWSYHWVSLLVLVWLMTLQCTDISAIYFYIHLYTAFKYVLCDMHMT